jgi:hypothetical protein
VSASDNHSAGTAVRLVWLIAERAAAVTLSGVRVIWTVGPVVGARLGDSPLGTPDGECDGRPVASGDAEVGRGPAGLRVRTGRAAATVVPPAAVTAPAAVADPAAAVPPIAVPTAAEAGRSVAASLRGGSVERETAGATCEVGRVARATTGYRAGASRPPLNSDPPIEPAPKARLRRGGKMGESR